MSLFSISTPSLSELFNLTKISTRRTTIFSSHCPTDQQFIFRPSFFFFFSRESRPSPGAFPRAAGCEHCMPRAIFRDVGGRTFTANLPRNSTVNDACHFLATALSLRDDQIRILNDSHRPRTGYDLSNRPLFPFYAKSPHHFVFQVILREHPPMAVSPPPLLYAACMKSSETRLEHRGYSRMVRRLPADLDARLEPLIAMGYDREKCEEAYRSCGGDIERAAERLAEGRPAAPFLMGDIFAADPSALFGFLARRRAEIERQRREEEAERSQESVFRRLKRNFGVSDEFLAEQLQAVGGDLNMLEALFN
jgi:hypothetical protein